MCAQLPIGKIPRMPLRYRVHQRQPSQGGLPNGRGSLEELRRESRRIAFRQPAESRKGEHPVASPLHVEGSIGGVCTLLDQGLRRLTITLTPPGTAGAVPVKIEGATSLMNCRNASPSLAVGKRCLEVAAAAISTKTQAPSFRPPSQRIFASSSRFRTLIEFPLNVGDTVHGMSTRGNREGNFAAVARVASSALRAPASAELPARPFGFGARASVKSKPD
jgi:hypothetical protein